MTNEEKYKTPEERNKAFRRFCDNRICNDGCPCHKENANCGFLWLALEAEEKPLPCSVCGGESIVIEPWITGGASVICKKCWAFIWARSQAEAIAAWNRSAK